MNNRDFRQHIIADDSPRLRDARGLDPYTYAKPILETARAVALKSEWQTLYRRPFQGVTSDGKPVQGLYDLQDDGFEIERAVPAMEALLRGLTPRERDAVQYPVDAPEWRAWYNPEIPFNDYGIRLDETAPEIRAAFLDLLRTCVSDAGYLKLTRSMSANLYLGELYDLRNIMNEWSYHFLVFGDPSMTAPWGWSVYGHHIAFNCFFVGRQIVLSPIFMGVEPNIIARSETDTFTMFLEEEARGLALMRSLSAEHRDRATIYKLMVDPTMPEGRFNFADQRHLGGAFQDNRVIPLEGIAASEFSAEQREQLVALIATFIDYLPKAPLEARLRQVRDHLDETYWSWIGGTGDDDPFYYRIQSPVILLEFDHHDGMWLTNTEPAKFHIHTIVRTPNGNDYGRELLRRWRAEAGRSGTAAR